MTLFKPLKRCIGRDESQIKVEFAEGKRNGKSCELVGKAVYSYLRIVMRHRPILWYLKEKKIAVPQDDFEAQQEIINELQKAFPAIDSQCGSCGMNANNHKQHLQVIISLHQIGGDQLGNIRFDDGRFRFQHHTKDRSWTSLATADELIRVAGFLPPPPSFCGPRRKPRGAGGEQRLV